MDRTAQGALAIGTGLALIAWIEPEFWKSMPTEIKHSLWVVALLLVVFGTWQILKWKRTNIAKDTERITVSGSANVISVNQTGGQTAHTIVNQASLPRSVAPDIAASITAELQAVGKKKIENK